MKREKKARVFWALFDLDGEISMSQDDTESSNNTRLWIFENKAAAELSKINGESVVRVTVQPITKGK